MNIRLRSVKIKMALVLFISKIARFVVFSFIFILYDLYQGSFQCFLKFLDQFLNYALREVERA